jgi:hypothetical protein
VGFSFNGTPSTPVETLRVLMTLAMKQISPDEANQRLGGVPIDSPAYSDLCKIFTGEKTLRGMLGL